MSYPKTMKALVAYGRDRYRLEMDYPVPECGGDDILIKTDACGICASDVKCFHGAESYWGGKTMEGWAKPPFIPGHEFLGHVVWTGENVTEFKVGDRVAPEQIAPCGECRFCKRGQYWMCQPHKMYGYFRDFCGGMAEYVRLRVKNSRIHKVPEDMPLERAVLIAVAPLMLYPGSLTDAIGFAVLAAVILFQWFTRRPAPPVPGNA